MIKYIFGLSLIFIAQFSFAEPPRWDCSKITLEKFNITKDCIKFGTVSANDKRDKDIRENKNCFVNLDIADKKQTLTFLTPSPYWRDSIGYSWQCDNSSGVKLSDLRENCSISLNQGRTETMVDKETCECRSLGCGQRLLRINDEKDVEKIKLAITAAVNKLDAEKKCDITFGNSNMKGADT